jgi:hypothetical protein
LAKGKTDRTGQKTGVEEEEGAKSKYRSQMWKPEKKSKPKGS